MQVFRLGFDWNVNPLTSSLCKSQWISQVESLKLKEPFHQSSYHHTRDPPEDMRVCVNSGIIGLGHYIRQLDPLDFSSHNKTSGVWFSFQLSWDSWNNLIQAQRDIQ